MLTTNNVAKLGNFALAQVLDSGKDSCRLDKSGRLPLLHMAPESYDTLICNELTDAWAFGVAMWEIMTYVVLLFKALYILIPSRFGAVPYSTQGVDEAKVAAFVKAGSRLETPKVRVTETPLYLIVIAAQFENIDDKDKTGKEAWAKWDKLMQMCFKADPAERPRFTDLSRFMGKLFEEQEWVLPRMRDVGQLAAGVAK